MNTYKRNAITITEIRLMVDENGDSPKKYFKARYVPAGDVAEVVAQSTDTDMFGFMKTIVSGLFCEDLEERNRVKQMSYDEFAKSEYQICFNTDLEPLHTVAVKDLKRVVETLKKYEDQWQGIQNLTKAFQQMYAAAGLDEEQNQLTRLINRMFDKELTWDPETQTSGNWSGICWGAEVNIRSQHCMGSWFLQGYIEDVHIRVFKDHVGIGIYTTTDRSRWGDRYDQTFHVDNKTGFLKYIQEICENCTAVRTFRINNQ